MSVFRKIFRLKDKQPINSGGTIQKLRETEEMLKKKQDFLETKIQEEINTAKKHGLKNKRAALQALKRKKRYEQQLQQNDGTLTTIELQRTALEEAKTNKAVLQTMTDAAKALKVAHQHLDVDKIHDMMDDIAEQQEVAQEISNAISNPTALPQDVDEDELERELELLEQAELDEELLGVGLVGDLHDSKVPDETPESKPAKGSSKDKAPPLPPDEDEEGLQELAAWTS